jgi:hypothetical protein
MKIRLTILALLSLAATAMAGDAEMKRQLIGTWTASSDDEAFVLTSDGRFITSGGTEQQWDVRGGNFIEIRPSPESERNYTIRSLTKHKCVIQENGHDDGIGIWTKITSAQANRPVLQPQDTGQYDSGLQESQRQPSPSNDKSPVILELDRALNDEDWSALSTYIRNEPVNFFGHRNASISFIRGDIERDARTYRRTRAYPDRSTFRQYVRDGVIYESIEERTEALEFNGSITRHIVCSRFRTRTEIPQSLFLFPYKY